MSILDNWKSALIMSLTLGLAPFVNEEGAFDPHIFGKIKWILGGANGMGAMDWFDTLMHGAPWVLLIVVIIRNLKRRLTTKELANNLN